LGLKRLEGGIMTYLEALLEGAAVEGNERGPIASM